MTECLNLLPHGPHDYLADADAITLSPCPGTEGIDPNCPHEDGPYHFWQCDGPFTASCDNCGADGRITMTSGPETDDDTDACGHGNNPDDTCDGCYG